MNAHPRRHPVWAVADVVVVLVLVALAVVGLTTTFADWGFLAVAEIAAAGAVLVVLATLRLPVIALVAAGPFAGILLAGPVALRSDGFGGGVPDAQTLADVMKGSWTGWGELLTTLPRVDLSGAPALVPFLLGYFGGLLACALALRSRSAGAPVLPLLGVLAGVLLLRRPATGLLEWHPVAFAVLGLAWVAFRGLGLAPEARVEVTGRSRGRLARGAAAVLVVAVALLVAVPLASGGVSGPNSPRGESLRGELGPLPVVTDLDSPLRSFREYTKQPPGTFENLHDKVLLDVAGAPEGSRVRFLTLDRYDGEEWTAENDTMAGTTDDRFQRMDSGVDNLTAGTALRVRVTVKKPYRSAWVPTVGSLTTLRFLYADRYARRDELRYNVATSTAVLPLGVKSRNDYEFTSILADDRLNPDMAAWPGPVLSVKEAHRADPMLKRVLASPAPPMRKVFVLARYLRVAGYYSDGAGPAEERFKPGHDVERLFKGFLLAKRAVGDDEQYAAAMAVLANRVGVPARVVVGAVVPRSGRIRGSDVHAWVEVRIADGSWRTLATERFMGDRPPTARIPPPPPPRMPRELAAQPKPTQQEKKAKAQAAERAEDQWRAVVVRVAPGVVVLLLLLVVPTAKSLRRRLRRRRGRASDRMAAAWTELIDHARDLGIPVKVHGSRPAQARVLARAGALSREGDDGVFAEAEPSEEAVKAYWGQVMRERRQLGGSQPLRRRVWAPFNPMSLIRRPGAD